MKKYIALIIVFSTVLAKAQFYTQVDFGYNLPLYKKNNQFVNFTKYENNKERVNTETTERAKLSIVKGVNYGVLGGYILKNKFKFELGINYQNTNKFTQNNNSVFSDSLYIYELYYHDTGNLNQRKEEQSFSSEIITVNPNISYLKNINKLSFSFTLGLLVQKVKVFSEYNKHLYIKDWGDWDNHSDINYSYKHDSLYKYEYPTNYYFNLYAGAGFAYNFTKNISAILSISMPITNIVYITNSDKKTQYYSKFTSDIYDADYTDNNGKTTVEDNEKYEIENTDEYKFYSRAINFSIGIRYTFNKKHSKS